MTPAEQLTFYMKSIYEKRLTTTSGGNLSIRDAEGNIWITPASVDKGSLTPADIVCIKPDGTVEGKHRPSSELPFHSNIYRLRPDLNAVLHAHPPRLLASSMIRKCPNLSLLPSVKAVCGKIGVVPYAVPGSKLLSEYIGKCFADGYNLALMENHGVCVGGADMGTAFGRFETLEYTAELEIQACRLGTPHGTERTAKMISGKTWEGPCGELTAMVRRARRQGLFTSTLGRCCVRREGGYLAMSGDEIPYFVTGGIPGAIFDAHPEIGAVIEAQPVHAMAFAVTNTPFDTWVIPESYVLLRDVVRLPEDAAPGDSARALGEAAPVALLENRCAITVGTDLLQAFDRLEVLETTAQALIGAAALGDIVRIQQSQIDEMKVVFGLKDG